uniref:Uncharacterized protein n=1 Tax=Globodera rostochiensis TaxID=31243 RepID=A0A914IH44_GLORO
MLNNLAPGCFGKSANEKEAKPVEEARAEEADEAEAFCNEQTEDECNDRSVEKMFFTYYCEMDEGVCSARRVMDD